MSEWGSGLWGFYSWGLDYTEITGEGGSSGILELTREYLVPGNGGSAGDLNPDYGFAATGEGGSSGDLTLDYSLLITGEGGSAGIFDLTHEFLIAGTGGGIGDAEYEYLAALVDIIAYVLNLNTNRTYQFSAYGFTGIGRFNGKLLGLRNNKIYDLETTATLDDATAIDAYIEIETDFGLASRKQLRAVFFQDNDVIITITDKAGTVIAHTITANEFRSLPKSLIDESLVIRIANVSGSQITLRRFHSKLNSLSIKGE